MITALLPSRLSRISPRRYCWALLVTLLLGNHTRVRASVYPTKPTSGTTYIAGQAGQVEWIDDGRKPLLGAMGKMRIELYARNDTFIATLARDIQPMALHTTILVPAIAPPSNHQYTMRFVTIDPALTVYSANFAIMPNPLTYQVGPRPTGSLTSVGVGIAPSAGVTSTRLGGAVGPNRPGIVAMSRYGPGGGGATAATPPPYPTPIVPGSPGVTPNSHGVSQTNNAVARLSVSFLRLKFKHSLPTPRTTKSDNGAPSVHLDMLRRARGPRARRESTVDVEKIKFRMVFILWPAMVGLTLAF